MAAQSRSKWFPCFLILLQSLLYGFGDPISKFAFDVMPVYSLLVLRYSMALVVLLLLFGKRIWKGLKQCSVKDWILPTLCMSGAYVVNNIALDLTAATSPLTTTMYLPAHTVWAVTSATSAVLTI